METALSLGVFGHRGTARSAGNKACALGLFIEGLDHSAPRFAMAVVLSLISPDTKPAAEPPDRQRSACDQSIMTIDR
jgi:hypothetical protein